MIRLSDNRTKWRALLLLHLFAVPLFLLPSAVGAEALDDAVRAHREGRGQDAAAILRPLAESGNGTAQYLLGRVLARGAGIERNTTQALQWLRKAADGGHRSAQFLLGVKYYLGDGVRQDAGEAARWFAKSAQSGVLDPEINLSLLYSSRPDEFEDDMLGIYSFKKSAQNGDREAQFLFASKYDEVGSVYANKSLAIFWYNESAEQGQPDALAVMGLKTALGDGLERNTEKAADFLFEAGKRFAAAGDPAKAEAVLATLQGVAPDSVKVRILRQRIGAPSE